MGLTYTVLFSPLSAKSQSAIGKSLIKLGRSMGGSPAVVLEENFGARFGENHFFFSLIYFVTDAVCILCFHTY